MRKYIIIDLGRSTEKAPMFWRADNKGYTPSPFEAGLYDEETVLANWKYYNDEETIAVVYTIRGLESIGFEWKWDSKAALSLVNQKTPAK